jgi:hypothetical protein
MADHRSYRYFKIWATAVCTLSGFLLVSAWWISGEFFGAEGSLWLCLLFGLPVLIQVFGLWQLDSKFETDHHLLAPGATRQPNIADTENAATLSVERMKALVSYSKFYLTTMAICLLTYSLLWVIYANGQQSYGWEKAVWDEGVAHMTWRSWCIYWTLSVFALVIIALLLCLVMWMTRAIIGESKTQPTRFEFLNRNHLKRGAAEAPFLTLIFFITVFLGVSYLFGFSFAFHDKARLFTGGGNVNHNEPALVMGNVIGAGPAQSLSPSPLPIKTQIATFTFDVGRSVPKAESEEHEKQLVNAVAAIEEKSKNDKALRILLEGGADLRQIKSLAYQSNYELAEARAQNTKNLILERLSTSPSANVLRNLEWTCLARPNEGRTEKSSHHAKGRQPVDDEGKEDRTVKVFVIEAFEAPAQLVVRNLRANHAKPLRLMDYVYFANYTITTTGYGDIVPNTTYAKFICSFANICEVLFLVVFFNALLSLAGAVTTSTTAEKVAVLYERWNRPVR